MAIVNYTESWIDTYNKYLGSINFTESDFTGLKEVIRDYVTRQNPEGINDWQESSEVGMFVNAIAYLGENINYRVDLNVNDLFPSTTERKQSLLNFSRMLSYNAKRNIAAVGLGKLISVSTTEDVTDTSGNLLSNVIIRWNDKTNENWMEQFLTVLNSAFVYTNQFGNPIKSATINNISNQIYQLNSAVINSTVFPFSLSINSKTQNFEVVNPNIDTDTASIIEMTPIPERYFNILYRNDGAGNSSNDTGFFVYWKQGSLKNEVFNFDEKIVNNSIKIDNENINENDVWFEEIDSQTGYVSKIWTKIPASEQLSYTKTDNNIRTIYKVETNENDTITLKFSDGYFGDIPYGVYRLWYRTSNGNDGLYIKPSDISNVSIVVPYYNNSNSNETNVYYLTLTFSVVDVSHIRQSVPMESMESIRENASAIYSTQNRMVTAKDYNYFPRTIGQQLRVLKSTERTYAGNSRFVDINDPTGTYNPVNVLATDGYLYSEDEIITSSIPLEELSAKEIYIKYIEPKFSLKEFSNIFYNNRSEIIDGKEEKMYDGEIIPSTSSYYYWIPDKIELGQNTMTGVLVETDRASRTDASVKNVVVDSEYRPMVFDKNKSEYYKEGLVDIFVGDMLCFQEYTPVRGSEDKVKDNIIWAKVEKITKYIGSVESLEDLYNITNMNIGDIYSVNDKYYICIDTNNANGKVNNWQECNQQNYDTITISEILDSNKCWKICNATYNENNELVLNNNKIYSFNTNTNTSFVDEVVNHLSKNKDEVNSNTNTTFAITYIPYKNSYNNGGEWKVVDINNDTEGYINDDSIKVVDAKEYLGEDYPEGYYIANWFIRVTYNSETTSWKIDTHETKEIFGSVDEASFFFNTSIKDASNDGYFITDDTIKMLKQQDNGINYNKDYYWKPYNVIKYADGYVDTQEFCCSGLDSDKDAIIDIPTQYNDITKNRNDKIIFLKNKNTSEKTFLVFDDLYKIYKDVYVESDDYEMASLKSSMWERTTKSGYYYSYHKINQIIPAGEEPKEGTKHLWTPRGNVVCSNGITYSFNHSDLLEENDIIFGDNNTYDFVDYIYDVDPYDEETYFEEYDDDGNKLSNVKHGYLYHYNALTHELKELKENEDYIIRDGIKDITFMWKHYPTTDYIIDPCSTNIIDMFVLTNTYYNEVQSWIQGGKTGIFPKAPSAYELKGVFKSLEANKMISDTIVWHPITYKLVFGVSADADTHCVFKVIKSDQTISDNEVKKNVIQCIDDYFRTMEVGETFYFTQLSTYIQAQLSSLIKTILIVPTDTANSFGNLFEIKCSENEIILSTATLNDVEIISTITDANIKISL